MKLPVRIALSLLCAAVVLLTPFVVSSPNLLSEPSGQILEKLEGSDELDLEEEDEDWLDSALLSWLVPTARADEEKKYSLPMDDFSAGKDLNPAALTKAGYEDDSIRVQMETREEDGVIWRIAWVEVASPSQLRTGIANPKKIAKPGEKLVATMAESYKAVVAMNGDLYSNYPEKKTFEYRMGQKVRSNTNKTKDMLIIDMQGDFHIIMAQEKAKQQEAIKEVSKKYKIYNAFTFGPALVDGGKALKVSKEYGWNPGGKEPRSAIGQTGKLSYVLVIAEGRGKSAGVTHQQLADFMKELGCEVAYNLDGGGSATMVFPVVKGGKISYKKEDGAIYNKIGGSPRQQSDIIYFATAVNPKEWKK